jgi:hypothetical protein
MIGCTKRRCDRALPPRRRAVIAVQLRPLRRTGETCPAPPGTPHQLGLGRIVALHYLLIHFIPKSRTHSVHLFLKRQCDRTLASG